MITFEGWKLIIGKYHNNLHNNLFEKFGGIPNCRTMEVALSWIASGYCSRNDDTCFPSLRAFTINHLSFNK